MRAKIVVIGILVALVLSFIMVEVGGAHASGQAMSNNKTNSPYGKIQYGNGGRI